MGKIPEALASALRQHGGDILLDARVRSIRIRNGRARGVEIDGLGFVEADFILSTVNAMTTYQSLLEDSDRLRQLVRKASKTPLSMSAFCIQLGISHRLEAVSHINHVVPMLDGLGRYIRPARDIPEWGYYSVPTLVAPELAPDGHTILECVPATRQDESPEAWTEERIDDLSGKSIHWLRSRHPMNIEVKRIRSPREFEQQLNLYRGAIYGVSAAKGLTGLFPHKTPIEGLYLAGQTTFPGLGVPTAALSGIHASKILMQERN
jgi:phytoene dehydrogenase-like protein